VFIKLVQIEFSLTRETPPWARWTCAPAFRIQYSFYYLTSYSLFSNNDLTSARTGQVPRHAADADKEI
jgi:hypothetical protein